MTRFIAIPIGFILITVTPIILWNAESQKRAIELRSAVEVDNNNLHDGYVRIRGQANADEELPCPKEVGAKADKCLYLYREVNEFQKKEEEVCSNTKPDNIIKQLPEQCSENGSNCQPCYVVEKDSWQTLQAESKYSRFSLGAYKVLLDGNANIVKPKTYTRYFKTGEYDSATYTLLTPESYPGNETKPSSPKVGDLEVKYNYIEDGTELLVAGIADGNEISTGDKVFVVSTQNYNQTVKALESQDSASKWLLRALSFFTATIGFILLMANLAAILTLIIERVPVVGRLFGSSVKTVAAGLGLVMGSVYWLGILAAVLVLKNIVAVGVSFFVLLVIVIIGAYYYQQARKL